jgi:hypothetical protein
MQTAQIGSSGAATITVEALLIVAVFLLGLLFAGVG